MEELTKNNHNSMKTVVETFLTEETIGLIYDNEQLDKWNKHVEELGLKGQTQIVQKDKSPIPFMHLKQSYKNICEVLCPRKVKVEDYNVTPIPNEILDLIALSKKENYFNTLEVWYDEKSPDPFVVGAVGEYYCNVNGETKYFKTEQEAKDNSADKKSATFRSWDARYYLLGKWADVKHSWEELKEIATKRFMAEQGNYYSKQITQAERALEDLQTSAFDKFN